MVVIISIIIFNATNLKRIISNHQLLKNMIELFELPWKLEKSTEKKTSNTFQKLKMLFVIIVFLVFVLLFLHTELLTEILCVKLAEVSLQALN